MPFEERGFPIFNRKIYNTKSKTTKRKEKSSYLYEIVLANLKKYLE
jgi:hypothetical protein